jgi:hypothetical protein
MRWALRAAILGCAAIALLELSSLTAGSLLFGSGFVARARSERARVVGGSALPAGGEGPRAELRVPPSLEFYALHPYLGFVADPASAKGPSRDSNGALVTTDLGFFRRAGRAPPRVADPVRVAVFGGSVAFLFSLSVDEYLEARLRGGDGLPPESDVVVESFALPGHKQPQQLFALEYLLLLGERFDLVLNLDGLNEITLPLVENLPQGTAAIYPRSWAHLARTAPPPAAMERAARVVALREMRRATAAALSWSALDGSATGNLLWRLAEAALAPQIDDAESRLAGASATAGDYAAAGPRLVEDPAEPVLDRLVEVWRRSSLLMHQVCAANGIAYLHVLQPNQYLVGGKPLSEAERAVAYRADHPYRAAVETGYPRLIAAGEDLRRAGVDFVDLSRAFADVSEPLYVDDCCHFNQRGNAILAERLAPALRAALARGPTSPP